MPNGWKKTSHPNYTNKKQLLGGSTKNSYKYNNNSKKQFTMYTKNNKVYDIIYHNNCLIILNISKIHNY